MPRYSISPNPEKPSQKVGGYQLGPIIGQGTYGKVRLGVSIETKEKVNTDLLGCYQNY
jgi:serine/threonine protein kinase